MVHYLDALETRDPEARERELFAALPGLIAHAKANAPYYGTLLADVDADAVTDRTALSALPVTRKSALIEVQKATPPLGGLATSEQDLGRVFQSPGPIYDPEGRRIDYWRMVRALNAAGFKKGELVHNTFSYHFTPGGWIFDDGARTLGCPVFPAGVGNSEAQVQALRDLRPVGYTGTPSFLGILLDKAAEMGADISSLKRGLVSGEAYLPAQRQAFAERGLAVYQCYASADLGLIAYEAPADDGRFEGMVVDEGVILEIVRPGTGIPVAPGEVGEVVVTTFTPEYPLIRFATGDLSAVLPGISPCGRTNLRIKGWMGRADQTTKVKGMFVHPEQIAEVVRRHPEVKKARLVVTRDGTNDIMTLTCECPDATGPADAIGETLRSVTKLKGVVDIVAPSTLANDGKVIEDARSYD